MITFQTPAEFRSDLLQNKGNVYKQKAQFVEINFYLLPFCLKISWSQILIFKSVIPFKLFFFAGASLIYVFYISCSLKFAETTANPLEIALLNIGCGSIMIQHLQHKYNVLELSLEMKIFLWHEMVASCNDFILLGYVGKTL